MGKVINSATLYKVFFKYCLLCSPISLLLLTCTMHPGTDAVHNCINRMFNYPTISGNKGSSEFWGTILHNPDVPC